MASDLLLLLHKEEITSTHKGQMDNRIINMVQSCCYVYMCLIGVGLYHTEQYV